MEFQYELFQILKDDGVKVLHSICQQIWKIQQGPQDWKRSVFIAISKKGNAKECSKCRTTGVQPWLDPGYPQGDGVSDLDK